MKGTGHGTGPMMQKDLGASLREDRLRLRLKQFKRRKKHPHINAAMMAHLPKEEN